MDSRKFETPYVETELLLAVMNDDYDRANELLAEMLPGEIERFGTHLQRLHRLINRRDGIELPRRDQLAIADALAAESRCGRDR